MEVSIISENEYSFTNEICQRNAVHWNGRVIHPISSNEFSFGKIVPIMQKTTIDVEVDGGFTEKTGGYVEGKISASFSFGGPKPNQSSNSENDKTDTEIENNSEE